MSSIHTNRGTFSCLINTLVPYQNYSPSMLTLLNTRMVFTTVNVCVNKGLVSVHQCLVKVKYVFCCMVVFTSSYEKVFLDTSSQICLSRNKFRVKQSFYFQLHSQRRRFMTEASYKDMLIAISCFC